MRDEAAYLLDMLDAARRAVKYVAGRTAEEFEKDDALQSAVLYRYMIIGESAKKISPQTRQTLPQLPFNLMSGLRDKITHVYWRVDLSIIWKTTTEDLPILVDVLSRRFAAPVDQQTLCGKFIVLDGTEGCGKSTQAQLLREAMERAGLGVLAVRDPGSTRIGEQIRSILLDTQNSEMGMRCEMLLYMAARSQMMAELILPALAEGKVVICDRFVSSTLAYQLGGDGLTADQIRAIADVAIAGRWPDLTIILDMPPDKSLARVQRAKDRIEQRPMTYHEQVRRNYLAQAQSDLKRYRLVSADRSKESVHADILREVESLKSSTT